MVRRPQRLGQVRRVVPAIPPANRSFAKDPDGNAAVFGAGFPCRNHTAPASTMRSCTSTRWPCSWFWRARKIDEDFVGCRSASASLVVYSGCQRSFFRAGPDLAADDGANRLLRFLILEYRPPGLGPGGLRIGRAGRRTRPRSSTDVNKPLGNCFPTPACGAGSDRRASLSIQVGVLLGRGPTRPHARVRLSPAPGIEEGVQTAEADRGAGTACSTSGTASSCRFTLPGVPALHQENRPAGQVVAREQFLAAHVLVAGGDVALADAEFLGPTRDGVLVEAHQGVLVAKQVPRVIATAKGIDLVPRQVPTPTANGMPRRTAPTAAQRRSARRRQSVRRIAWESPEKWDSMRGR